MTRGYGCFTSAALLLVHGGIHFSGVMVFAAVATPSLLLLRLARITALGKDNGNDKVSHGVYGY
uniref:Uncharacterized protein n=1 Tax=Oryza meridionalis TaxID=40149 RepID=A0A0E0EJD2_9ORYZ